MGGKALTVFPALPYPLLLPRPCAETPGSPNHALCPSTAKATSPGSHPHRPRLSRVQPPVCRWAHSHSRETRPPSVDSEHTTGHRLAGRPGAVRGEQASAQHSRPARLGLPGVCLTLAGRGWGEGPLQSPSVHPFLSFLMNLNIFLSNSNKKAWGNFKKWNCERN